MVVFRTNLLSLLLCATCIPAFGQSVESPAPESLGGRKRWQPFEISLTADPGAANPFMMRFEAELTAPDGARCILPGFYDGESIWKLRVLPHSPGKWLVVTRGELAGLQGRRFAFECLAEAGAGQHGRLLVDAKHPRHFIYEDGARCFLMAYECDWLWALDAADPAMPVTRAFLKRLSGHGFNSILLNAYAYDTSWRTGTTGPDDFGPPPLHPWQGTPETPDHSRLNLAYWKHFDRTMQALHDHGIIAHLMCKVYNKKVRWPEPGSREDELFFRTLVARCCAYPGLVWNFSKEAQNEKNLEYKLGRLRYLKSTDPYGHLVTVHDDNAAYESGAYGTMVDFRTDQHHKDWRRKLFQQRSRGEIPILNAEFGYEHGAGGPQDVTYHIAQSGQEVAMRAWEISFVGAYTAYYHTHTAWDVLRPEIQPPGYALFSHLRRIFESTRYWELIPRKESEQKEAAAPAPLWILENPGKEYLVWAPQGRVCRLREIGKLTDGGSGKWWNPLTGESRALALPQDSAAALAPPADWSPGPIVLHLRGGEGK